MSFVFETLKSDNLIQVNAFLIKHFFSREPLGLKLGIQPETDVSENVREKIKMMSVNQISVYHTLLQYTGGLQYNETFILWANPHEVENNWEEICPEKYYKQGSQSSREA